MVEGKHNHYIQSLTQLYRVIGSKAVIQYLERKLITHILQRGSFIASNYSVLEFTHLTSCFKSLTYVFQHKISLFNISSFTFAAWLGIVPSTICTLNSCRTLHDVIFGTSESHCAAMTKILINSFSLIRDSWIWTRRCYRQISNENEGTFASEIANIRSKYFSVSDWLKFPG